MLPKSLEPIAWLLGVILLYAGVGGGIVLALMAARTRLLPCIGTIVAIALIGAALYFGLPLGGAARLLVAGSVVTGLEYAAWRFVLRPRFAWHDLKFGKEAARQTMLHLVLLTGSIIFLIPFAWLVVTSLKEDSEMSKFPPVWIPTQQVKVVIDGSERKLSTITRNGRVLQVGIMKEMDTGGRRVQVVKPADAAGQSFVCNKKDLTDVRHVAPVWKNYPDALKFLPPETHYGLIFLKNTLVISGLSILGTLLSSSMVAYSFSRLRWPGRDATFVVLLATMMLPGAVTMMPQFLIFRSLGWVDTLKPLWVPSFFASAFNVFMLRQFFMGIPTELEEAALLDGCSYYMIFWRIMLPQIKPALAAITIMAFMGAWNDFQRPLIYISSPENQPLAYALQLFQTGHSSDMGQLMACSTLVMLPVIALFFFSQRYFIQGITLTGIKG